MDYHVVPDALRENVRQLHYVADSWADAKAELSNQHMEQNDLGYLGVKQNIPDIYNTALNTVLDRLQSGFEALNNAAESLKNVADDYESRDAEFYTELGYIDDEMNR
ncbi:hypothetical protein [Actinoalloteichus hymeniacidonis]|uniref:Excreted virulence factor EspC, type VII ESX diderm n=1 Tax=Actinoalloteichus hymeniacidonis TaxID=340345 RepID=A0AAC9HRU6_9PSEU|nr:hypothetical protein [Actinoalloteichus hymeniacidonis]AOS64194.1 hypothetical protein TL08_16970 [Actinoalloteichus hymeniacidonis]MBB5907738.1 hypothetical protein [Actinoalloteichus hymeniacidonis]